MVLLQHDIELEMPDKSQVNWILPLCFLYSICIHHIPDQTRKFYLAPVPDCRKRQLLVFYKLLFLGHRSLIKKITQTAVINIVFQRIFIKLDVSYAGQHTLSKVTVTTFKNYIYIVNNRGLEELKPSLNVNISSEKLLLF